jgi:hypothetical protein
MASFTVENIVILLFFGALILSSICLCYKRYVYEGGDNGPIQASSDEMVEVEASPYSDITIECPLDSDTMTARAVSSKSADYDEIPKASEAFQPKVLIAESVLFYE